MTLDPVRILHAFTVSDGALYRRNADGTVRRILLEQGGRLIAMLDGKRLNGPEVAWICHHGFPSPYPVVTLDTDPHNMYEENLMPARVKRLVFRPTVTAHGVKHPLSKQFFPVFSVCKEDWVARARQFYEPDRQMLLAAKAELGKQILQQAMASQKPAKPFRLRKPHVPRPQRPDCPEGFEVHWYKGQWVTIPVPVHVSDDWMVRAEACLANPGARFRFDATLQRTVQV